MNKEGDGGGGKVNAQVGGLPALWQHLSHHLPEPLPSVDNYFMFGAHVHSVSTNNRYSDSHSSQHPTIITLHNDIYTFDVPSKMFH